MAEITALLAAAWEARMPHNLGHGPRRLFNGFREGLAELVVDLYGETLVIFTYTRDPALEVQLSQAALVFFQANIAHLRCALLKRRSAAPGGAVSELIWGNAPDMQVEEDHIHYALDLTRHQDATLYLDTRLLRRWAASNLAGQRTLNTFAYTGSLGIAALAGGAEQVVQTDLEAGFLELARRSYALNGWKGARQQILPGDFFRVTARLRHADALFDCIFLDPPFFSQTPAGRFDLNQDTARLVNKVRPLLAEGGRLVVINNAVFVSGQAFLEALEVLCADGYLALEETIPVPADFIGLNTLALPANPAPFNHSTKIAILRGRRKDGRKI